MPAQQIDGRGVPNPTATVAQRTVAANTPRHELALI